jgi:ABC-type multidrug transport system ATPase subunit
MQLTITLSNVQQIKDISFGVDTGANKLTCIVGKNGAGKTTLIKSIKNLSSADTFTKTSAIGVFNESSVIRYLVDEEEYLFNYDVVLRSLSCRSVIPENVKSIIDVELPMPYGQRFSFFQKISEADKEIRKSIVLEEYSRPDELIEFLNAIYGTEKFETLVQIAIKGINYYCFLLAGSRYVREDHLSSGEYFLINLYRKIKKGCKLIVIDEIDISLDAATQARLVSKLREFCSSNNVNIVFTTHSLAIMRTLNVDELFYMQESEGVVEIVPASYNYIKSLLFGFSGWDKYLLTEDVVLKKFIEFVIGRYCPNTFYQYKIIYVGGADNVVSLMNRNATEHFLSSPENVISILDGDKRNVNPLGVAQAIYWIPFDSVEKKLFDLYQDPHFQPRLPGNPVIPNSKSLYNDLIQRNVMSESAIFLCLCNLHEAEMATFSEDVSRFLYHAT